MFGSGRNAVTNFTSSAYQTGHGTHVLAAESPYGQFEDFNHTLLKHKNTNI